MSPPSSRRVQGESAYEVAKKRLELAGDRDAILDAFFEYSQELFKFSVLFVVKGDVAHGRRVHGLGAPEGLVARLVFPLGGAGAQGGILKRAWEYKKAFVASPAADGEDAALIGSLGRAMPVAVVAPVVVSGRVVAILLGEGPKRFEDEGPAVTDATLMELAKDRMFAWTDNVGDAFERLIVRRKSEDGNVVASLRRPPSSRQPSAEAFVLPEPAPKKVKTRAIWALPALGLMGLAVAVGLLWPRSTPDPRAIAVRGEQLAGWPAAVDPLAALELARQAASVLGEAELLSIRAEIGQGGTVDVAGVQKRADAIPIAFLFASEASTAEVRVDTEGFRGPKVETRGTCDGRPCGRAVKPPQSTFAQIWEAATKLGAAPDDRLRVTYVGGEAGPEWSLAIDGRGTVVLEDATRKPRSRERFRPPARPLAAIPGAPSAVDPIAVLPIAREQSGLGPDSALLEIEAKGVGSDGTVDLSQPDRRIVYRFSDPENLPIAERRWRQVTLDAEGMPITSIASDRDPLPSRVRGPVALPRCSFGQVWSLGLLTKDARARVIYGSDETLTEAGQWTLEAPGLTARVTHSDLACVEPEGARTKPEAAKGDPGPGEKPATEKPSK